MKNTLRKVKIEKQKEAGITLIALIITIIVLLILAGITIGVLTSNNSVLKQAGSARKETLESEESEKVYLAIMDAAANAGTTITGELTTELVKNAIKNQFGEDAADRVTGEGPWKYEGEYKTYNIDKTGVVLGPNATIAKDSNNDEYPLPRDATYKEGTVDDGLVIKYKGSEFVWIPVEKETLYAKGTTKAMAKYLVDENEKDSNGRTKYAGIMYDGEGQVTNSYIEPTDLQSTTGGDWATTSDRGFALLIRYIDEFKGLENNSTNQEKIKTDWAKMLQEEYDAMIESVKTYGGFYIGRYETSTDIKSVKDADPITSITVIDGFEQTWYGLYQRQKKFTSSIDSMVASMIWGSQYDAMLNWAEASNAEEPNFEFVSHSEPQKTGAVPGDVYKNIYDLVANTHEWTLEGYNNLARICRGGNYFHSLHQSSRKDYNPDITLDRLGSRIALYIK